MTKRGMYEATKALIHRRRFDSPPVPSLARMGCWLTYWLRPNRTEGQARYLFRVTMIKPERNMPDVPRPSLSLYHVGGRVNFTARAASLGSSLVDIVDDDDEG